MRLKSIGTNKAVPLSILYFASGFSPDIISTLCKLSTLHPTGPRPSFVSHVHLPCFTIHSNYTKIARVSWPCLLDKSTCVTSCANTESRNRTCICRVFPLRFTESNRHTRTILRWICVPHTFLYNACYRLSRKLFFCGGIKHIKQLALLTVCFYLQGGVTKNSSSCFLSYTDIMYEIHRGKQQTT